ncbi:MAG TPA: hypothetical protein VL026_09465 [Rhizomicrobium sp.]|nr:hypothetical protein [Rhizomicrobium sp.]
MQAIGARAGFFFLALLPVAVWLANPHVLGNVIGDVDTWFYLGNFMDLGRFNDAQIRGLGDYYVTRLPYILPGYVIFHLFSLTWAKIVFAYLIYSATIWPLYYTFRAHMADRTALLAIMLIASDIFITRAVNWNYVDAGVMAYQALSFAALTAARTSSKRHLWVGVAAFFFTCSIFCHLGSAFGLFPLAGYAWLCFEPTKQTLRASLKLFGAAVAGVAACQIVFGALNVWINDGDFFFVLLLYKIAQGESHTLDAWRSPTQIVRDCSWLTIPFAAWVASALVLGAAALRLIRLERFQAYALLTSFGLCSALYISDSAQATYFFGRSGMYASLYIVFCYVGIAGLLMRGKPHSLRVTLAIGSAFVLSLLVRLHFNGTSIPFLPEHSGGVWLAGLGIGLLLAVGFFIPNVRVRAVALCLAALPTLYIQWTFDDTRDAYQAIATMRTLTDNKLPIIWADLNDPLYQSVILPVTASFTQRAWWAHKDQLLKAPPDALGGNMVFVLSSTLTSPEKVRKLIEPQFDRVMPIHSQTLHLSHGDLWIGAFRVWNWIGVAGAITPADLLKTQTPASQLFTVTARTENGSRHAIVGKPGQLTFGPYLSLASGRYLVTIIYGPSSGDQRWDVAAKIKRKATTLIGGPLPPTTKSDARVTATLNLPHGAVGVEIRTRYSGEGTLSVHRIGLRPLFGVTAPSNAAP